MPRGTILLVGTGAALALAASVAIFGFRGQHPQASPDEPAAAVSGDVERLSQQTSSGQDGEPPELQDDGEALESADFNAAWLRKQGHPAGATRPAATGPAGSEDPPSLDPCGGSVPLAPDC